MDFPEEFMKSKIDTNMMRDLIGENETTLTAGSVNQVSADEFIDVNEVLNIPTPQIDESKTIGEGAVGKIFEIEDPGLKRKVALKVLKGDNRFKKDVVDSFLKEARLTSSIEHPNIIPIHSLGIDPKHGIYYTMKKIKGDSLEDIITKMNEGDEKYLKKFSLHRLIEIFIAICRAVAYAHSKGIIHRDLKPANIIVGDYGEVYVSDWGLIKCLNETSNRGKIQQEIEELTGMDAEENPLSGTPTFMAPEQIVEAPTYKSDQYSLGVTLYRMLTGAFPYNVKGNIMDLFKQIAGGNIIPIKQQESYFKLPKRIIAVCEKMMENSEESRYESLNDTIKDLENYWESKPMIAYKAGLFERLLLFIKRNPKLSTAAISITISLMLSIAAYLSYFDFKYSKHFVKTENYRQNADNFFNRLMITSDELDQERIAHDFRKTRTSIEGKLMDKLSYEYNSAKTFYFSALAELQMIPPTYNPKQTKESFKNIISKLLEISKKFGSEDEVKVCLETAKKWIKTYNWNLTNAEVINLKNVKRLILGKCTLVLKKHPNFSPEIKIYKVNSSRNSLKEIDSIEYEKPKLIDWGQYILKYKYKNEITYTYPFVLNRGERNTITVPAPPTKHKGMVYIPGGVSSFGGFFSMRFIMHKRELQPYLIGKNEVTFGEYYQFLKELPLHKKLAFTPKVVLQTNNMPTLAFKNGKIIPSLNMNMPVYGISYEAAKGYASWLKAKTKLPYRLPTEFEWEKAGRTLDAREYVWGNYWINNASLTKSKHKAPVAHYQKYYPKDVSLYGVVALEGNVREYVTGVDNEHLIKGSGFTYSKDFCHLSSSSEATNNQFDIGFRLVIPLNKRIKEKLEK